MREGVSSHTASWVALFRGLASYGRGCTVEDRYASRLLSGFYTFPLHASALFPEVASHLVSAIDGVDGGAFRHFELRTRAIDDAVLAHAEHHPGAALILLGAGLDARGFRLHRAFSEVLEIDHPATQAAKRQRVRDGGIDDRHVSYIPCDFAHQTVEDVLGGHTWAVPPAVVWEGVTMYLPSQAIDATLGALRTLLPIGSLLATTYFGAPPRPSTRAIVRLFGEPFAFDETPPAFAARLARHHFELQSDSGDRDWNEQYLKRPLDRPRDATTRLLRFRRRPFDERLAVAIHVSK